MGRGPDEGIRTSDTNWNTALVPLGNCSHQCPANCCSRTKAYQLARSCRTGMSARRSPAPIQTLAAGLRMRCIQCLKLLRCQYQRQGDGVFLYMCHGPGFGNCNDVTAADGPGQRNSGCGASVCCGNTTKNG